jgi:hypothetical protein
LAWIGWTSMRLVGSGMGRPPSIEQHDVAPILGGRDRPVKMALQCVERS